MKTYEETLTEVIDAKLKVLNRLQKPTAVGHKAPSPSVFGLITRVEGEITAYTAALNLYTTLHPKPGDFDDILLTKMAGIAEELLGVQGSFQPFPTSWRNLYGNKLNKTPETLFRLAQMAVSLTVGDPGEGVTFQGNPPEVWVDTLLSAWSDIPEIAELAWAATEVEDQGSVPGSSK